MADSISETPEDDIEGVLEPAWEPPKGSLRRLATEMVGPAVGVALGLVGDPVLGAALGPAVTAALWTAMEEIRANNLRQAGRVLEQAAAGADFDGEDLVRRLLASPESIQFLATALNAAAAATDEDILAALARGLANAASDKARVSDEAEMARALREIGPPHLRLMRTLFQTNPVLEIDDGPNPLRYLALQGDGQTRDSVLHNDPALGESWDSLIATVTRLGLVAAVQSTLWRSVLSDNGVGPRNQQVLGPQMWRITEFGTRLYDRVRNHK